MLEAVIVGKGIEADKLAERKKAEAEYVAGIVRENWNLLVEISGSREEVDEKVIFESTLRSIENIGKYCRAIGLSTYQGEPENYNNPLERLGWVNLRGSNGFYVVRPAKKGYEVLNGLRSVRGQISIEEVNQKFKEKLFGRQKP